jgi:hypothetical protein
MRLLFLHTMCDLCGHRVMDLSILPFYRSRDRGDNALQIENWMIIAHGMQRPIAKYDMNFASVAFL